MSIDITLKENILMISGQQSFNNADNLAVQGLQKLSSITTDTVIIDTHQLTEFNSAILAVLLQWHGYLSAQKRIMKLVNMPQQLQGLIQLTQLQNYLYA